ncbi:MAG: stage II sporulation protein D [Oscillospiraceae bacterium]|nr:stage II sporulation protein D [Oscillospiraceae bacterium]
MRLAFTLSFLAVFGAALLVAARFPCPAPQPTAPPLSDAYVTFSVKTDSGIESVNMADYLPGVLAGEMPALFETQALMAQAVAARTYILHRMEHGSANHPEADICNNPACCKAYVTTQQLQKNWGAHFEEYFAKISAATANTDGQYLTYHGDLIEAVFHSSSAGATEASGAIWNDRPYLVSVDSPESETDVPNFISQTVFSPETLQAQLTATYPDMTFPDDPAAWFTDIICNESGRVQSAQVCNIQLTGTQLRSALGLRSTAFTVSYSDNAFTFTATGYGHGVGMSQYGANVYAKQGWGYADILAHYYPNTQLTSAAG